jgi:hypothetical protein
MGAKYRNDYAKIVMVGISDGVCFEFATSTIVDCFNLFQGVIVDHLLSLKLSGKKEQENWKKYKCHRNDSRKTN